MNIDTTPKEKEDIKEEVYGKRLVGKEVEYRRQRSRTAQDNLLDSLIEQSKKLATKHFSELNIGKEREIPELLKKDYIQLIEENKMDCLKAYSIVMLAETMLSEVNRHFVLRPFK